MRMRSMELATGTGNGWQNYFDLLARLLFIFIKEMQDNKYQNIIFYLIIFLNQTI